MNANQEEIIRAEFYGRDCLEIKKQNGKKIFSFVGCQFLFDFIQNFRKKHGDDLSRWPLPEGAHHVELLLKELLMKDRGLWTYPYADVELCHCRSVPTEVVDQAILGGAHTPERVSSWTSASTACGTCRPVVQKIISYRLGKE